MNASRTIVGAWVALIALTTVRTVARGSGLPQPSAYLGGGVLMTLLYGLARFAPGLASAFAVGVPIAAVLRPYIANGRGPGPLEEAAHWLDSISGGVQTTGTAGQGVTSQA